MLPCVCSVIDHRWRQSVVGSGHTSRRRLCHWYFLPHFDVLCDLLLNRPTQHGIYLFYSMIKKVLRTTHNLHRTAWLFYGEICASLGILKFPNATFRLSFFFSSISLTCIQFLQTVFNVFTCPKQKNGQNMLQNSEPRSDDTWWQLMWRFLAV